MYNIGEKLKTLRQKFGFSQPELAEKIKVTKPTYAGYEKGKDLSIGTLDKLSKIFNIPIESFFLNDNEDFKNIENKSHIKKVPIVSKIPVELKNFEDKDILDWIEIPSSLCEGADYAIFTKGDSMETKILENDLILIHQTNTLNNGNIGLFKIEEEILCRKFFSNPITKEIVLKSLNKKYDPIYIEKNNKNNFSILGKVICKIDYNF